MLCIKGMIRKQECCSLYNYVLISQNVLDLTKLGEVFKTAVDKMSVSVCVSASFTPTGRCWKSPLIQVLLAQLNFWP